MALDTTIRRSISGVRWRSATRSSTQRMRLELTDEEKGRRLVATPPRSSAAGAARMDGRDDGRPLAAHLSEQQRGARANDLGPIHVVVDGLRLHRGEQV